MSRFSARLDAIVAWVYFYLQKVERYPMGLNIKNPETVQLVRELAERTGRGQTEAVTVAVREALRRLKPDAEAERRYRAMGEIAERMAPLLKDFDMDDALYGPDGLYDRETGLPK